MSDKKYFHLTLGPVQGFVAQARRSRDYWAGSFILSWLSGVAISSVKNQGGQVLFPVPDDKYIKAITAGCEGIGPLQGGIPNRFKTDGLHVEVDHAFDAKKVVNDVKQAWQALAKLVWTEDLAPFFFFCQFNSDITHAIWQRQIDGFWDINWVLNQDKKNTNALDRRKNWRSQYPSNEAGSKCMMMVGYQELSGTVTPNKASSSDFWSTLKNHLGAVDLNKNEHLCALAFVKRRFARHFYKLKTSLDSGLVVNGWAFTKDNSEHNSPLHVPSLPYLAALPWLVEVSKKAQDDEGIKQALNTFAESAEAAFSLPSKHLHFKALKEATGNNAMIMGVDGLSCFSEIAQSDRDYKQISDVDKRKIDHAVSCFKALKKQAGMASPAPFYALLLMDGDSLGAQMSDPKKQKDISAALNAFTSEVPGIIEQHNGFLVYAGGDDVLALLPMDHAIDCAAAVKQSYDACFKGKTAFSTLSGAIQFAHIKTPLMKIIKQAHGLLDDVAKDKSGRDSLAIRINKPGGIHAEWVMPWDKFVIDDLRCLSDKLIADDNMTLTNGWLKRSFDLIKTLSANGNHFDKNALKKLIAYEYKHSGGKDAYDEGAVEKLLALVSCYQRTMLAVDSSESEITELAHYQADGIKLLRFLSSKGVLV